MANTSHNFHYKATGYRVFADATHGNDGWDGLTPLTPKKTLNGVRLIMSSTRYQAIITGYFKNQIFGSLPDLPCSVIADGLTIIEYYNNSSYLFSGTWGTAATVSNVIFIGVTNISGIYAEIYFTKCVFFNSRYISIQYGKNTLNYCLLYNCVFDGSAADSGYIKFNYTKILNSYLTALSLVTLNYVNKSSLLNLTSVANGAIGTFNNYECKFKYGSTYYDNLAALVAVYPSLNDTEGNKNMPVTFNNFAAGDFSVPADSPLLDTSKWNASVCGNATKGKCVYFSEGSANWTISQTDGTNDIELVSNEAKLVSGKTVGTITRNATAPIDIGSLQTLKKINYLGLISFASGAGNNIPSVNSYVSGEKGYSPVRMTVALKTSPISLAEADWNAMSWKEFDLLETPRTDGVNGSGHPDFDFLLPAWSGNIQARYFLVKITLRTTV